MSANNFETSLKWNFVSRTERYRDRDRERASAYATVFIELILIAGGSAIIKEMTYTCFTLKHACMTCHMQLLKGFFKWLISYSRQRYQNGNSLCGTQMKFNRFTSGLQKHFHFKRTINPVTCTLNVYLLMTFFPVRRVNTSFSNRKHSRNDEQWHSKFCNMKPGQMISFSFHFAHH